MKPDWLETVYKDLPYILVGYDPYSHTVVNMWKIIPTSVEYRAGLELMTEAMTLYKTPKMISYIENLGAISEEDQKYTLEDWFPKAMQVGFLGLSAIIQADNVFSQLSMEMMVENNDDYDPSTPMKYFSDKQVQEARDWLKTM